MQKQASFPLYFEVVKLKRAFGFTPDSFLALFVALLLTFNSFSQITVYEDRFNLGKIPSTTSYIEVFFFNSTSEVIHKINQVNGELSFNIGSDLNLLPGQYVKLRLPITSRNEPRFNELFHLKINGESELISISIKGKFSSYSPADQDCPDFNRGGKIKRNSRKKNLKKLNQNRASVNVQFVDKMQTGSKSLSSDQFMNNNLILLVDASSSMLDQRKKEFVDHAFEGLAEILRPVDQITVMAYSDEAQIIFTTSKNVKYIDLIKSVKTIKKQGVTNGSRGIKKAYMLADSTFVTNGNNEIILITDGAFNANETDAISEKIISKYEGSGIRLSIIGIENQSWAAREMKDLTIVGNGNYVAVKSVRSAKSAIKRTVKNHARK